MIVQPAAFIFQRKLQRSFFGDDSAFVKPRLPGDTRAKRGDRTVFVDKAAENRIVEIDLWLNTRRGYGIDADGAAKQTVEQVVDVSARRVQHATARRGCSPPPLPFEPGRARDVARHRPP